MLAGRRATRRSYAISAAGVMDRLQVGKYAGEPAAEPDARNVPRHRRSAYRVGLVPALAALAAAPAATRPTPVMSTVMCEPTPIGATLIVAPGDGLVTVEAWLGGGTGDERAESGLAHLAEHVALAAAERGACGAALRAHGGGLDGWVTPDATVFRAIAPAGALDVAMGAVAAAAGSSSEVGGARGSGEAFEALVSAELARVRAEEPSTTNRRWPVERIERWWAESYAGRRTIAVRGSSVAQARRAIDDHWRPSPAVRRAAASRMESRRGATAIGPTAGRHRLVGEASALALGEQRLDGDATATALGRIELDEVAALVLAAAATRIGGAWADVIAMRSGAMWIGPVRTEIDRATLAWARAGAWLPLLGVDGLAGELAAGVHVHGDVR
jgi:hypothetical protein